MNNSCTIGIIGYGRFGRLAAHYLAEDFEVLVCDTASPSSVPAAKNIRAGSLQEVGTQDIIIPCVPISAFELVIKDLSRYLAKDAVILDVCSVKEYPAEIMQKYLPKNAEILATHPLFGPDSAAQSLAGKKIVLCKIRISDKKYRTIKNYLTKKKLRVIEATPQEHDQAVATTLVLTHFIGRSLLAFGARTESIDTSGYQRLMSILETVEHDSWQLFDDMNRYNRYASEVRKRFIAAAQEIDRKINLKF